jgi:hypothetical protein
MTNDHQQLCNGDKHPFSTHRCLFTPTTSHWQLEARASKPQMKRAQTTAYRHLGPRYLILFLFMN